MYELKDSANKKIHGFHEQELGFLKKNQKVKNFKLNVLFVQKVLVLIKKSTLVEKISGKNQFLDTDIKFDRYLKMDRDEFYVVLPSNNNTDILPNNKTTNLTLQIPFKLN